MRINIIAVGKIKEKYFVDACSEYLKRLSRFDVVSIIEVPEAPQGKSIEEQNKIEGESILNKARGYIIAMDIDGKKIVVKGSGSSSVVEQLQQSVGSSITLSLDEEGNVSYQANNNIRLSSNANRLAKIIDNSNIIVSVNTVDQNITSNGYHMDGGAFRGNTVINNVAIAHQEVNAEFLRALDNARETPGQLMMHEVTEAYEGARISISKGKSSPQAGQKGSVYNSAHNRASPQGEVFVEQSGDYYVINRKGERIVIKCR